MHDAHPGELDAVADAALQALDADQVRALVRDLSCWLDDASRRRLMQAIVERAARAPSSGWSPDAPSPGRAEEIEAFADAAQRVGVADPTDVDGFLCEGTHAFLARDYATAARIFQALLVPLGDGSIDLGQRELIEEVLGVDVDVCAKQHVVAVYMTASSETRGRAVLEAIEEARAMGYFDAPLDILEAVAVEPLPDLDAFLAQWRAALEARIPAAAEPWMFRDERRWLREVIARLEGADGLAAVARQSRAWDDLKAWCRALLDDGRWAEARAACDEAAELVEDGALCAADFVDAAALAAREMGDADGLNASLERAWRLAPTLDRLRRWLGGCTTQQALIARASAALEGITDNATRQRAVLLLIRGEPNAAAELLADAPALGWSDNDHPGHVVFPILVGLLSGAWVAVEPSSPYTPGNLVIPHQAPQLHTPTLDALLQLADLRPPTDPALLASLNQALRTAAEARLAAVTEHKRRRHYAHAASLAVQLAQADGSPEADAWLRGLIDRHRRYPALKRAFQDAGA